MGRRPRVFYDTDEKAILREMTFTAGYSSLNKNYYDYLGSKINLKD